MISSKTNGVSLDSQALLGAATGWCCAGGIRRSLLQDLLLFKGFSLGEAHAPICKVHYSLLATSDVAPREDMVLPGDVPQWTFDSEQEFDASGFPWDPKSAPHSLALVAAPTLSYQVGVSIHDLLTIRTRESFIPKSATAPGLSSTFENTGTISCIFAHTSRPRLTIDRRHHCAGVPMAVRYSAVVQNHIPGTRQWNHRFIGGDIPHRRLWVHAPLEAVPHVPQDRARSSCCEQHGGLSHCTRSASLHH